MLKYFIVSFLIFLGAMEAKGSELPTVQNPVVLLSGPWEFYWQKLLEPTSPLPVPDALMQPITAWNLTKDVSGKTFPARGFGTYRIELKRLPGFQGTYGIDPILPMSAMKIYIFKSHSKEVLLEADMGQVGAEIERPSRKERVYHFRLTDTDDVTVLFQVSNHLFINGGILLAPKLARDYALTERRQLKDIFELIAFGIQLGAFVYNLLFWYHRRNEKTPLYLALSIAVACTYLLTRSAIIKSVLPESSTLAIFRLEFLMIPAFSIFPIYLNSAFPTTLRVLKIIRLNAICGLLLMGYICISDHQTYIHNLPIFQIQILISLALGVTITYLSIKQRSFGYDMNLLGFALIFTTGLFDIINALVPMADISISPMSMAIYVGLQSKVIAERSANAQEQTQRLILENAHHQEALRLEVEAHLKLAAEAAHRLNNPLNYIQQSVAFVQFQLEYLHNLHRDLLGTQATDDEDLLRCRQQFEECFQSFLPAFRDADHGLELAGLAVKKIRALSGIDGYEVIEFAISPTIEEVAKYLSESLDPQDFARIQWEALPSSHAKIISNRFVLAHIVQLFMELMLKNMKGPLKISTEASEDRCQLVIWVDYGDGDLELSEQTLTAFMSKLEQLSRPFSGKWFLIKRDGAIGLRYLYTVSPAAVAAIAS